MRLLLTILLLVIFNGHSFSQWITDTVSEPRSNMASAVVGDKILFGGGYPASNKVDMYDVLADTWTTHVMTTAKYYPIARTVDSKVFFMSEDYDSDTVSVIEIYDDASQTWSIDTFPTYFVHYDYDAEVYNQSIIFNLDHYYGNQGLIVEYNTMTQTWSLDSIVDSLSCKKLSIWNDEALWYSDPMLSQQYLVHYNLITHAFSFDSIPGTVDPEIYTAGNRTFIVGGFYTFNTAYTNAYFLVYNHITNTYFYDNYIPGLTQGIHYGEKMYIVGGHAYVGMGSPYPLAKVIIYDLLTDQIDFKYLSDARFKFALAANCGRVYVAGGYVTSPFAEADNFDILDTVSLLISTTSLPTARFDMAANATKGKAVFAGGQKVGVTFSDEADIIDCAFSGLNELSDSQLMLYPNPATNQIKIEWNSEQESDIYYSIFNAMGEVKLSGLMHDKNSVLDLTMLSNGVYIIRTVSPKGIKYSSTKFIISK